MSTTNYDWVQELDLSKLQDVDSNTELIIQNCGVDVLLQLTELFGKSSVYFSEKVLYSLKKEYIVQNKDLYSVKELSRILDVSKRYVYAVLNGEV